MQEIGPVGMSENGEMREEEFGELGGLEGGIVVEGLVERICVMRSVSAGDLLLVAGGMVVACVWGESSARKRMENSISAEWF